MKPSELTAYTVYYLAKRGKANYSKTVEGVKGATHQGPWLLLANGSLRTREKCSVLLCLSTVSASSVGSPWELCAFMRAVSVLGPVRWWDVLQG